MKKALLLSSLSILLSAAAFSCNSFFTYTNACAGDTIFFHALDQAAVYTWDFGDTGSVANVSHDTDTYHIYINPGTYYVTLFTNIGFEWDYRTQIITVDTNCFKSDFDYLCSGGLAINFTNRSTGNFNSILWNFGDTASGANDTSTSLNSLHTYSSAGTYIVTLITNDSLNTDTSFQTINVDTSCLSAQFYNLFGGDCIQDTTTIGVAYTGNPTSFYWDFGDTASGSANFSTDDTARHQFSSSGLYLLTLIISDSIQTDTFYTVQNIIDCSVWPGNTNMDGQVNIEDFFAIGIFFGDSGTTRSNASNQWMAQPSADWDTSILNNMYLQDLVDKKHADCNGDGIINSLDITALNQNYGNTVPGYSHNDNLQMMPVTPADPVLQVETPPLWNVSMNVSLPIDLSAPDSVRNIYGIAARIYYDASVIVPGSVWIDFTGGWMGISGLNEIAMVKDFHAGQYVEFAIVRADGNRVSGNGTIAYLNFTLTVNTTLVDFTIDPIIRLISNGTGNQEVFLPVSGMNSQLNVINASVDLIQYSHVRIYPNPVNNYLNIKSTDNSKINRVLISDLTGRIVLTENNFNQSSSQIDVRELTAGIYMITVEDFIGRTNKLIVVK